MQTKDVVLPAIHDWHLQRTLEELGLMDRIKADQAQCAICQRVISLENIGGIKRSGNRTVELICDRPDCLFAASERRGHV